MLHNLLNIRSILLTIVFVLPSCGTTAQQSPDDYFHNLLDARLEEFNKNKQGSSTAVGVAESWLELIDARAEEPELLYIALLDYYLGEAAGTTLAELITVRGDSMLPLLYAKRDKTLMCESRYASICVESAALRNMNIDYLAAAIRRGEVVCGDSADCGK